ncbi:MAG TPA: tRNA (cytidine(34)-2'-O)-methyltransferase [Bacillota bacterium]|nr:tRNA (cytidine(34)-2'-O)-methyltransferase [Bacillota bacterium]
MLNIVLVEPEIPPNTGNVARSCAASGARLYLVGELGFSIDDRQLKRAGLDYWHLLEVERHESLAHLWHKHPAGRFHYLSTRGKKSYHELDYRLGDFIVFGKETAGLPQDLLDAKIEDTFRIPMRAGARSLNLSNAVAVVLFEGLRQLGFPGMV